MRKPTLRFIVFVILAFVFIMHLQWVLRQVGFTPTQCTILGLIYYYPFAVLFWWVSDILQKL